MKHVVVGLSGGVDSSVSALLLKEQGYRVTGVFMKNWEEDDTAEYCSAAADLEDVKRVCATLGIEYQTINFAAEYWDNVFEYFLAEYAAGRTPNPDILCNKEIKFKAFWNFAKNLGADYIATGHYAQVINNEMHRSVDTNKDQTYFLYTLENQHLEKVLFPIGHLPKPAVRALAEKAGLINHNKKDSTGICFIGERRFKDFLAQYLPAKKGDIVTKDGKWLGRHTGLMYHTLGQRQGLGIGGVKGASEEPWYVVAKDLKNNTLVVAQGNDSFRECTQLECTDLHLRRMPQGPLTAKIRYRSADVACTLVGNTVTFEKPVQDATPGQAIVFYDGPVCLGGATIVRTNSAGGLWV